MLTTLDPKSALVVIDLQKGIAAMAGDSIAPVIAQAAALAGAFRKQGLPVVLVNVVPSGTPRRTEQTRPPMELPQDFAELLPEMKPQASDHRITKQSWGAFTGTGLKAWLKAQGVTEIVLCGVATSIGIETTARQAFEAGFNIAFASDAMADLVPAAHENSLTRIFPRLGETGSTLDIVRHLERV